VDVTWSTSADTKDSGRKFFNRRKSDASDYFVSTWADGAKASLENIWPLLQPWRRATRIETQKLKKVFGEELLAASEESKQKK
jgi:hypothetical protein